MREGREDSGDMIKVPRIKSCSPNQSVVKGKKEGKTKQKQKGFVLLFCLWKIQNSSDDFV